MYTFLSSLYPSIARIRNGEAFQEFRINFPAEIFNLNVSHLISIRTQTSCSHRTGVLKIDVKATVESTLLVSKGLGFRQLGPDPWKVLGRKALYLKVLSSFTTTPQFQRESSLDHTRLIFQHFGTTTGFNQHQPLENCNYQAENQTSS